MPKYKKTRMKELPMICECGAARMIPSQEAYKKGGVICAGCKKRMKMNVEAFPQGRVSITK